MHIRLLLDLNLSHSLSMIVFFQVNMQTSAPVAAYGSGPPAPFGGYGVATPQAYHQPSMVSTGYGGSAPSAPYVPNSGRGSAMETEMVYAPKHNMGRLIGSKGVTINDLQKRSGCDIQINQNVPPGHDCEITMTGTRQAIEIAKSMIMEIQTLGPNHPYAGGNGNMAASDPYGASGGYSGYDLQSQTGYGYQQPPVHQAQFGGYNPYGQQASQPIPPVQMPGSYSQPPIQNPYGQHPTGAPPQPAMQTFTGYGGQHAQAYAVGGTGGYSQHPVAPPPPVVSEWKAATTPDGQTYYYNARTNVTQWTKPAGMP
jgi:hypothetical protein